MSLKAFHLFFIAVSVLLAFGVGVWGVLYSAGDAGYLGLGLGSFVIGIGLIAYGALFLRKLKHVR